MPGALTRVCLPLPFAYPHPLQVPPGLALAVRSHRPHVPKEFREVFSRLQVRAVAAEPALREVALQKLQAEAPAAARQPGSRARGSRRCSCWLP